MIPATNSEREHPKLQRNTLQLRHAVVMAIAAMSPVGAIFFNIIGSKNIITDCKPRSQSCSVQPLVPV